MHAGKLLTLTRPRWQTHGDTSLTRERGVLVSSGEAPPPPTAGKTKRDEENENQVLSCASVSGAAPPSRKVRRDKLQEWRRDKNRPKGMSQIEGNTERERRERRSVGKKTSSSLCKHRSFWRLWIRGGKMEKLWGVRGWRNQQEVWKERRARRLNVTDAPHTRDPNSCLKGG